MLWHLNVKSQFTPKMKANVVPRLLSSLVWIDQYNECNGMTSFMEFMGVAWSVVWQFKRALVSWDFDVCLSPKRRQTMLWRHKDWLDSDVLVNDWLCWPVRQVWSIFAASQHCMSSFWRQTNIKISRDLGDLSSTLLDTKLTGCRQADTWQTFTGEKTEQGFLAGFLSAFLCFSLVLICDWGVDRKVGWYSYYKWTFAPKTLWQFLKRKIQKFDKGCKP